jgi:hypothetical protein
MWHIFTSVLLPACTTEVVEVACGVASMMTGETIENVAGGIDCISVRQPLGVSRQPRNKI